MSVHVPPAFPKLYSPFAHKSFLFVMDWETHTNSLCGIMWGRDVILWRHIHTTGHNDFTWEFLSGKNPGNHIFWPCDLDLWPTTLTYNPSLAKVKVNSYTKNQGRRSNGSAVRVLTDRQTDTQKHGSDSMTSTADAGGNNTFDQQSSVWDSHRIGLLCYSFTPVSHLTGNERYQSYTTKQMAPWDRNFLISSAALTAFIKSSICSAVLSVMELGRF